MAIDPDLLVQSNPGLWLETYGKIRNAKGKIEPVRMNILQRRINAAFIACRKKNKPCFIIGLKPRKRGFSTMVAAIHYTEMMKHNYEGVIVGNKLETSLTVLDMLKVYVENDGFKGHWGSPHKSLTETIRWDHGSTVSLTTAKAGDSIRGQTPQFIHGTEVAHWDGEEAFLLGLMNALPDTPGVSCFLESTPEGDSGGFSSRWNNARWPTPDECPKGQEGYHEKWAASCPDNSDAMLEDEEFIRVFAAWFEFEDARTKLSQEQRDHIRSTIDKEPWYIGERDLIKAYGEKMPNGTIRLGTIVEDTDVWEQLAWRRSTIKNKCGRDPKKFDQEYPRDPASCAARGTRVSTRRGWIPIEQVIEGDVTPYGVVKAVAFMGIKPTVRVITHLGYSVRLTGDHRVKLADGEFCRADELIGNEVALDFNGLFSDENHVEKWTGFAGCNVSLEIDSDLARFLGYFMGDGSIHNATLSVVCDAKDEDVIEDVAQLLSRFGESHRRSIGPNKGGVEVRISRKEMGPLFEILGIAKQAQESHWKREIRVPECIWRSPKHLVREFLRGLFEADGWISATKSNVKFFAKDLEFARDVQRLLLGFGIHGMLRHVVKKAAGKEYLGCELTLHSMDAQRFCDVIGFVSARKQGRAEKPMGKGGKPPTNYSMRDRVVAIEDAGIIDVYDIQIEGEPVFCADGITVHNCFLSSGRPVFDMEAIEHYKLMAKSRCEFGSINRQEGELRATWMPTAESDAMCWRWETPKRGCAYMISIDTSEGEDQTSGEDPDRHSVLVHRRAYREPNGVFHKQAVIARIAPPCRVPILSLVRLADDLSIYYGRCIVIPEMNSSGLAFLTCALMLGIPIWKRKEWNKNSGKVEEKFGWRTTDSQDYGGVRTTVITFLQGLLTEQDLDLMCPNIVWELSKFVQKGRRMEAGSGAHDDDVMSLAIGAYNIESATVFGDDIVEKQLPRDVQDFLAGRSETGMNAHNW